MSDLTELLTTNDPKIRGDVVKRELARRSHDIILVHNPTNEDFFIKWDAYQHGPVPNKNKDVGHGKGNLGLERYLGMKYIKDMTDKILQDRIDKEVNKELKKRRDEKLPELDPYDKNIMISGIVGRVGRTDNKENRLEVYKLLYLGLVREFGKTGTVKEVSKPKERTIMSHEFDFMLQMDEQTGESVDVEQDPTPTKEEALSEVAQ
jgi:hypothetical protein